MTKLRERWALIWSSCAMMYAEDACWWAGEALEYPGSWWGRFSRLGCRQAQVKSRIAMWLARLAMP